ncbi:MAG: hypothetical protein KGS72_21915 [Cyanobacteria bacterium REEB67]|nr:hypothetical protein [Cyanobacteria bacterium REEB67]
MPFDANSSFHAMLASFLIGSWLFGLALIAKRDWLIQSGGKRLALLILCNLLGRGIFSLLTKATGPDRSYFVVLAVYIITAATLVPVIILAAKKKKIQ